MSQKRAPIVIENELIEQTIGEIRQAIRDSGRVDDIEAVGLAKEAAEFYSSDINE